MGEGQRLTWKLYDKFGGRKKEGYLSLIVDVKTGIIYPVPLELEHIKFALTLLGKKKEDIEKNPGLASHLIPSLIFVDDVKREVIGVLTGSSGMEPGFGVRHEKKDLNLAYQLVLRFINEGNIKISDDFSRNAKVTFLYAK